MIHSRFPFALFLQNLNRLLQYLQILSDCNRRYLAIFLARMAIPHIMIISLASNNISLLPRLIAAPEFI